MGGVTNVKKENDCNRGGVLLFLFGIASCNSSEETVIEQSDYKYGVSDNFEIDQNGMETQLFGGHRFAPKDGTFDGLTNDENNVLGWRLYKHAEKYLTNQLAEFNYYMQQEPNEKFRKLAQKMEDNNAFAKPKIRTIDTAIAQNNNDCAELFANMIYPLEPKMRDKLMACYDYLANRAYNASLGQKAGTMKLANRDLDETKQELQNLGIAAKDFEVESTLYDLLSEVKEKTGVSVSSLHRGVNLALCTAGMHGARDLGGSAEALSHDATYVPPGTFNSKLGNWTKNSFTGSVSLELQQLQHLWNAEQEQTMGR